MSRVRSRDTGPEITLRKKLFAGGLRYRVNYRHRGGKIDIAFPRHRLAVLVDGCFWHGCPKHGSRPKNNRDFWERKFAENRDRDSRQEHALVSDGWTLLRFWEHDIRENIIGVVKTIRATLESRDCKL